MKHQHASLLSALVLVIQELLDPSSLRSRLLQLGKRHFYYGASPAHYGHVGAAMLWALSTHLGERMTQEIHEAWSDTISFIATVMIEGGKLEEEAVNLAQEESERGIRRLKEEAEMAQTMVKESHATI
jgi:hemoglobin-like flavoprotein